MQSLWASRVAGETAQPGTSRGAVITAAAESTPNGVMRLAWNLWRAN